jgi:hypothetical protein
MNFVGYTYKADVEAEKMMLVNVLKELDSVSENQFEDSQENAYNKSEEQPQQMYNNRSTLPLQTSASDYSQSHNEGSISQQPPYPVTQS